MSLSSAQLQVLKNDILANTNTVVVGGQAVQIKDAANNSDANFAIAAWYSQVASPAYQVWRTDAPKADVDAAINKASFTPTDNPPASGSTQQITNDQLLYANRAMACQLKQANAQWITAGQGNLNASTAQLRQNFMDCLTQIPSGASGANQNAGWGTPGSPGAVRLALMRSCRNIEKLFVVVATGAGNDGVAGNRGTSTNPDALVYEGIASASDVEQARNLP